MISFKIDYNKCFSVNNVFLNQTLIVISGSASSDVKRPVKILDFLHRTAKWEENSREHNTRLDAVKIMLITSGYSVTMVDHPDFRKMVRTLDPKFKLTGTVVVVVSSRPTSIYLIEVYSTNIFVNKSFLNYICFIYI